ncbi:MAG: hypothetical protein KF749_09850 [Bacteroidetes bacterium]|nr:hypothetical protein [Bacteroidota bacterium]MCW5895050.1 hypothetical protein [Bacteroidota bacterium]
MTTADFPSDTFSDSESASRAVVKLHDLFLASGSTYHIDEFSQKLAESLRSSPDPDLAATNLLRFAEATMSTASLFNDFIKHAVLADVLMKMLSYSRYFADILVRDPELFRWLTASDSLLKPRSGEFLREETVRAMRIFQKPERKLDSLRRMYRREILRIGARDILGEADLQTLTEELSRLADALVDASCSIAHQQLAGQFPLAPATPYSVIGLGKLGGVELNYSSDIDILFVYQEEGELTDAFGRVRTYHEYFNALVEKIVQNLSQSSAEGHLYRVDTRLRPESGAGPLARSLQSYLAYYESRGELWERQMLIKARAIAGDREFGERFLSELEPFVYPRTFFHNPLENIARIKARIEAAIAGEENVKLRAGGIRDIEFIVQALQLLNGGKNRDIRSRSTLQAMKQLAAALLLSEPEERVLADAYVFFRTIEHRLQTMLNTQTHAMPDDEHSLLVLARKVGMRSADDLRSTYSTHLSNVRRIFNSVLAAGEEKSGSTFGMLVDGSLGPEALAAALAGYGFCETRKAAKNIASLMSGSALVETRELDARARDAFREIAETLLSEIVRTASPDLTLHNLALIAAAQKFPEHLYTQLRESNFRKLLLAICAASPRLSKRLARHPLLLETLATDLLLLAGPGLVSPLPTRSLVELKNQEELRAGIRYILGVTSFAEMANELSQLANIIVVSAFNEELKKARRKSVPLAVFALGKFGTREINFDSDLDLLFVTDEQRPAAKDKLERMSTGMVNRLSVVSAEGKLYDVDARLRPEGRSAPLVVEREAYLAYLNNRASLWERQSLTRLRCVAGDEELGKEILRDVEKYVFESPLPFAWVEETIGMRKKTESRSLVHDSAFLDIKLGAGGMVDIEFLAQAIQLKYGGASGTIRHLSTTETLEYASPLPKIEAEELVSAYSFYRRVETQLRITLEERGNILPEDEQLDVLARGLGFPSGADLHMRLVDMMKSVRKMFLSTMKQLSTT